MTKAVTVWFAARREDLVIIAEWAMGEKVFAMNMASKEFSIIFRGKKVVFGELLRVDMSPEALLENLDIREGQKLLLLPASSGIAG